MHSVSDPRTIVTPDAFAVADELVGTPLAPPLRRLAAILLDLLLIFLIAQSGWILLGVAASAFFFRMAVRRPHRDRMVTALRAALGCFGISILLVTVVTWWAIRFLSSSEAVERVAEEIVPGEDQPVGLLGVMGGLVEAAEFTRAEDREEAQEAGQDLARLVLATGASYEEVREVLDGLAPDGVPWREEVLDAIMATLTGAVEPTEADVGDPLSLDRALREYAGLVTSGDSADLLSARSLSLRQQIRDDVARDSILALEEQIAELHRADRRRLEQVERNRAQIEELQEGSRFVRFLGDVADEVGLTSLWGALYMAFFLAWWGGRTPGKRLLGIRVIQLDGKPMSWWMAFERAGGYAAGLATGLLGFLQIYWDPNRQAIHDKIAGTVVVRDGAAPLPGPWRVAARPGPRRSTLQSPSDGKSRVSPPPTPSGSKGPPPDDRAEALENDHPGTNNGQRT
jgi:uncharacterized RDD family membrane protein YckC